MPLKHNKKRNVGLINEFFARYMARAIIDRKDTDLKNVKELFSKHFQKGTDLHRELRLFNTLFETRLSSSEAAGTLIEQVKQACKLQSQARVDLEKTALLHECNRLLGVKFFDQAIPEYRDYATIQVLLNHWRGSVLTENISESVQLEDNLIRHLTQPVLSPTRKNDVLQMSNDDVDGLVVNIMTEKLNKKFSSSLNSEQKKLLQLYVFAKDSPGSKTALVEQLESLRMRATKSIETALVQDDQAKKVGSKLLEIKTLLQEAFRDTSNPDDKLVTFYMSVSKLEEELNSHE